MEQIAVINPRIKLALQATKEFLAEPDTQDYIEARRKFQMVQNTIIDGIREEGREEGRAEGREEGRAEGEEIGLLRGQIKQSISALLQTTEWLLGEPSEKLRSHIESLTDLDEINRLYEMVVKRKVGSLEELEQTLQE